MKKRILLLCLILVLLSTLSMGTYAYFTAKKANRNVITTGNLTMELLEKGGESHSQKEPMIIMPGDEIDKEIRVKNIGGHPMYVRIELAPTVVGSELDAKKCIQMNINTAEWQEKDGCYYYKKALNPGETTAELFTKVTFVGEAVTNEYLGKKFQLDVNAFAVQSENNGKSPTEAHGWPEK